MKAIRRISLPCVAVLLAWALPCVAQDFHALAAEISQHIAASGRKSVGVIDFTDLDGNRTELGRYLAEEFSDALFGEAKGFEVIDRTHLKVILQEHKLATTGLIDPATAKMLGQFAGVDTLVTGTITPFEERVHLSLKVLDTETAKILAADTIDIPRTKTISDLLGPEPGAPSSSAGEPSTPKSSAEQARVLASLPPGVFSNQFLFTPRGCQDKGGVVFCLFTVANKAESIRSLVFSNFTFMVDDQGNQYNSPMMSFGGQRNVSVRADLIPDVAVNLTVEIPGVPSTVNLMNASLAVVQVGGWGGYTTVLIRKIPVSRP